MGRFKAQGKRYAMISLLGLTFAASACQAPAPVVHVHSGNANEKGLVVVGEGEVEVIPDKVTIRFGVRERDSKSEVAMQKVEKKVRAMLKTLSELGIPENKIKTDQLSLFKGSEGGRLRYFERDRDRDRKKDIVYYYEGIYMVEVELYDFEKLETVLAAVQKAGVNSINDIDFDTKEHEPHFEQARAKAIAHAMKQAKNIAKNAGQELGEVISIATAWSYEGEYGIPGGVAAGLAMDRENGQSIPIRPGTMTFSRKIRMRFSLEGSAGKK